MVQSYFVAKTHRFDEEKFVRFATDHSDKYGIDAENGYAEVSTWHVDDLIRDFKTHINTVNENVN